MSETVKSPNECETMLDVRLGVDDIDRQIMELLEYRFAYMRAAARIKQNREAVRDEERKGAVIRAVAQRAAASGLPADEITMIWDRLVEASIAYELEEWDGLRRSD